MTTTTGQRVVQELRREAQSKREHIRGVRITAAKKMIYGLQKHGKLTQEDIAEKVGLSQAVISRYARGITPPTIPTLKALRELLQNRNIEVNLANGWREL
jgi:predicted transcriptional regulator